MCYCTRKQKMNFEGFTQNGYYGNQPQLFEVVFYSIDANTSCSFTKQDLTVKHAYCVSFCFVLWYEPKFWLLTLVSSAFYRLSLETTSFYATPIGQIIPCYVTEVKILRFSRFESSQRQRFTCTTSPWLASCTTLRMV